MKISPTLKITIILAAIYVLGWFGLNYLDSHNLPNCGAAILCGFPVSIFWVFGFPVIAIIIIIAALIMEVIDSKRNKASTDQK